MVTRTAVLIGLPLAAACFALSAGASTVPVAAGDYVRAGVQCRGAPFAATIHYDGRNFSGPHSSDCATTVVREHGARYALSSTCKAAGDASPARPYTEAETVRVKSASRFSFTHRTGAGAIDRADYRLCAGGQS